MHWIGSYRLGVNQDYKWKQGLHSIWYHMNETQPYWYGKSTAKQHNLLCKSECGDRVWLAVRCG
jgi:hypothetical protein